MVVRMRVRMMIMRLHPLTTLAPSQAKEIMRKGKFWGVSRAAVRIIPQCLGMSRIHKIPHGQYLAIPTTRVCKYQIYSIGNRRYFIRVTPLELEPPHLWLKRSWWISDGRRLWQVGGISWSIPQGEYFLIHSLGKVFPIHSPKEYSWCTPQGEYFLIHSLWRVFSDTLRFKRGCWMSEGRGLWQTGGEGTLTGCQLHHPSMSSQPLSLSLSHPSSEIP